MLIITTQDGSHTLFSEQFNEVYHSRQGAIEEAIHICIKSGLNYFTQQEIYVQTTRDYRRAIDYLETRPEIDASRVGIVGYSMGGAQTFLLTGVEPRVKAAVSVCTPADRSAFSQIAPQNFTSGIGDRPFLMIMGETDSMCPPALARNLHSLIPSESKGLIFIDAGHKLPPSYVPLAVQWIQKYLK